MNAKKLIFTVALVLSLVASAFIQRHLNHEREELGITRTTVISNAPPVLAFTTVALGAFRGLIANALWIRTTELQEEGKYFEAVQLADWITKLQPHSDAPWIFQAWNMAYNISVKFPDPNDRWLWVQRGIELLRDEGLKYNPNKALMYRELAWFFQHKMGANLDDAHLVYKGQWAVLMNKVLPGGHPDYAVLMDPKTPEQQAQVKELVEKFKLDPRMMQKVDQTYGPLDWRLPETHAIYWAMVGIENSPDQDKMPLRRTVYQPMLASLHHGRVLTNQLTGGYDLRPNLAMIPNASKAYEDAIAAETPQNLDHIGRAHRNFLKDAVYFLYANNKEADARRWFNYLKDRFGVGPQSGIDPDATMESFALGKIEEDANETSRDRVTQALQGLLSRSFYNLAAGDDDQGIGLEKIAQRLHAVYGEKTKNPGSKNRVALPPLGDMKREVLLELLRPDPEVNPEFQQQLRTRLSLPADFGIPATNAPAAIPAPPPTAVPATPAAPQKP